MEKQNTRRKICVMTGTRAEYGLFLPLLKLLKESPYYQLQLLVTGMHLSPEFGLTYQEIEKDGFIIDEKVEILLSSDTHFGTIKSTGLGMIGFADAFKRLSPDWVFLLGDRFETFAAATSAYLARIPIGHLHGGEITEGATDEGLRHAITKMTFLHFASADAYRKRIIQLGESPDRVFNVGAIGLDNIYHLELLTKEKLQNALDFEILDSEYVLVTFHPVTLENNNSENQFRQLLDVLDKHTDLKVIFTLPNADAEGRAIIELINHYVAKNSLRTIAFKSLGQLRYLSAIKHCSVVIGNSSSGIIEVPSFKTPVLNIGDRQKGRLRSENIIDVEPVFEAIDAALTYARSSDFKSKCEKTENLYGNGDTAQRILSILDRYKGTINLKKTFYDL